MRLIYGHPIVTLENEFSFVSKYFDMETNATKICDLYNEVVKSGGGICVIIPISNQFNGWRASA